jgi:thiamine kinase-like enzyme
MNHHSIVKAQLAKHFATQEDNIVVLDRLKGGMSNSNYVVSVHGKKYTFRIPGKNAEVFVDRDIERQTLELIRPLHIDGNAMLHLELDTGYKVSSYIEGESLISKNPADYYEDAAVVLHQLHDSGLRAKNDYAPFERLSRYEALVKSVGLAHDSAYFEIRDRFFAFKEWLGSMPATLCHNDSQPSNFIDVGDKLVLVDWEFGGNNDPFYDIACYGNFDFNLALGLLPIYLEREPTKLEIKRLTLWRTFQCLQWHNVALYKEAIGLSQELHLDFLQIARNYIAKANALFEQAMAQ